ncbi:MAG: hypothetical protein WAM92_04200 [Mycobacterium sp.]
MKGVAVEIWLQQQAGAVLTALSHAQDLYGGSMTPRNPEADPGGSDGVRPL